jgi:hypothetical protein
MREETKSKRELQSAFSFAYKKMKIISLYKHHAMKK